MNLFQTADQSVDNYITMLFRNFSHIILVLQMIGFPFQSEMVPPLTVWYNITQ